MKNLTETIRHSDWWKNFLMGVLAAAIGVGLTFEVDHCVERAKQKQAQRQTAMMAIYDIDDIAHQFSIDKQREDAFYKVAMYLSTHQEELENVSMDSLWMAASYIFYDPAETPRWADDSKEQVFTSSMDALQNIGDITFYDNVQECYLQRRNLLRVREKSLTFRRPVSEEYILEYRKHLAAADMNDMGLMNQQSMSGLLRQVFRMPEVVLFLQKYLMRDREYQAFIDHLVRLNQENKFIMNVTDEDMARYVAKHINKTMPAKPKQLVGKWQMHDDNQQITYLFRGDRTATSTTEMDYRVNIYVEEEDVYVSILAPLTFTIDGQWTLDGDSLRLDFDPETAQILAFDLDLSSLPKSALERAKDNIETRKQQYKDHILLQLQTETRWSWANKVLMGKSGYIMFWEQQYTLPWGQLETEKAQLFRTK